MRTRCSHQVVKVLKVVGNRTSVQCPTCHAISVQPALRKGQVA